MDRHGEMLMSSLQADERAELEPDTSLSTGRVVPLPFDLQQAGGQELGHIIHNGSLGIAIL